MILKYNNKEVRSNVIKKYLTNKNHYDGVICFSCGNATKWLKQVGVNNLIDISSNGMLLANKWFTQDEIAKHFPRYFDATSGHLPIYLMEEIGKKMRKQLNLLNNTNYEILCGSGETLVCLALAHSDIRFTAIYDNANVATTYNKLAPLNNLVKKLASNIIIRN